MTMNNVKLSDVRPTKTIELPSYKGSKVTVFTSLLVSKMRAVYSSQQTDFEKGVEILVAKIKEWNLVDENGTPCPINMETLDKFPEEDFKFLMESTSDGDKKKA